MATVYHRSGVAAEPARREQPGGSDSAPRRLNHPGLERSLQRAYSAERAASLAYIGHAASLRDPAEKAAIKRIEDDEWTHRRHVLAIMHRHDVPVSRWFETRYYIIGKIIGACCHVLGWFMPYFFAGKLESGNVCEYFVMLREFRALGINEHDVALYEMGMKEKEHEVYFLEQVKRSRILPWFEKVFSWGRSGSLNDVDFAAKYPVEEAHRYCARHASEYDSGSPPAAHARAAWGVSGTHEARQ